jgi:hypothetical protein
VTKRSAAADIVDMIDFNGALKGLDYGQHQVQFGTIYLNDGRTEFIRSGM